MAYSAQAGRKKEIGSRFKSALYWRSIFCADLLSLFVRDRKQDAASASDWVVVVDATGVKQHSERDTWHIITQEVSDQENQLVPGFRPSIEDYSSETNCRPGGVYLTICRNGLGRFSTKIDLVQDQGDKYSFWATSSRSYICIQFSIEVGIEKVTDASLWLH